MTASRSILPRSLFLDPPDVVARALLGKLLLRHWHGEQLLARIVETEAYFGMDDPAAHAAAGRTARNSVLWGEPGHAYVYFIYGMHACLNVSCEPAGQAGCVLVRALEPLQGLDTMRTLRGLPGSAPISLLTGGPGRLCQALGITREALNGVDLLAADGELQLLAPALEADLEADLDANLEAKLETEIIATTRIGISKAAERPLRFLLANHPCVSGPRKFRTSAPRPLP